LLRAVAKVRESHPSVELTIIGEGYERPMLQGVIDELGAGEWAHLPGSVSDADVVALYRRAWLVASSSAREGWGMTVTEAAACGTPAVVTRIAGHTDAVIDNESGLLADDEADLATKIDLLLSDDVLRKQLGEGAIARAAALTWDATALGTFDALATEADRRRHR
jgi:glycosyltransferase involved in cell wall biosynthesis